ncbi:IOD2 deiodinase, partial [Rhabdornis inornatus]|nr:IOD2 deiodinase [Rhabdornis inornatus]
MGLLSVDLLITLQILPVFFSNCLFLALYDSVILLKHMVLFLSRSKSGRGQTGHKVPRMNSVPQS